MYALALTQSIARNSTPLIHANKIMLLEKIKSIKIFYGWWIVVASVLISMYTGGADYLGFTAIIEPIRGEFKWSYTQISFAASILSIESGLLAPVVGFLIDRWGTRKTIMLGTSISGLGLILLSHVNSLLMFYRVYVFIAISLSTCVGPPFFIAVIHWFKKRISLASGIVASGFALGGILIPPVTKLINTHRWRPTMAVLGIGMWIFVLPLSLLIKTKSPLDDPTKINNNIPNRVSISEETIQHSNDNVEVKAALGSRPFWHISLALACHILRCKCHTSPYYALSEYNFI